MSSSSQLFTRDKFPEFSALRRAAQAQAEWLGESRQRQNGTTTTASSAALATVAENGDKTGEIHDCMIPPWIRAMHHFLKLESTIQAKISRLREEQRGFLQPKFLLDEEQEKRQQQQIEQSAQDVQKLLRELERMILSGMRPQEPINGDEQQALANAKKYLSSRLSETIQKFREGQELYASQLKRCETMVQRYRKFGSHEAHERMEEEEKIAHYLELGYTQVDIQELLVEEAKQQQVSREIQEILTSVTELHTMFNDLGSMVVEQGSVLDRIDFNLQQSLTGMKSGVAELKKAQEKQSSCYLM